MSEVFIQDDEQKRVGLIEITDWDLFKDWNYDDVRTLVFDSENETASSSLGEDIEHRERVAFKMILNNLDLEDIKKGDRFSFAGEVYNMCMRVRRLNMRLAMEDKDWEYTSLKIPTNTKEKDWYYQVELNLHDLARKYKILYLTDLIVYDTWGAPYHDN